MLLADHSSLTLSLTQTLLPSPVSLSHCLYEALTAESIASFAVAYDNAPHARAPVNWNLPKVWIMSTVLGLLLAAGTWICRATMFTDSGRGHGIIQNFGSYVRLSHQFSNSLRGLTAHCIAESKRFSSWR